MKRLVAFTLTAVLLAVTIGPAIGASAAGKNPRMGVKNTATYTYTFEKGFEGWDYGTEMPIMPLFPALERVVENGVADNTFARLNLNLNNPSWFYLEVPGSYTNVTVKMQMRSMGGLKVQPLVYIGQYAPTKLDDFAAMDSYLTGEWGAASYQTLMKGETRVIAISMEHVGSYVDMFWLDLDNIIVHLY